MPISALPTPPSRSDAPQDFSDRADALLGALPGFVTEANALQSDVNAKEASASSYATIATDKAAEAQASATTASTKASEAAASAVAAAAAASNAEIAFDSFDDKYLGSKAGDPATDNDGNPLLTGALYWNTTVGAVRVWNGSAWLSMAADASIVDFQQAGTGAVVRTAQDKIRESVSVKDFGAVGDGVTDDTAAIQRAIDQVASVGGGNVLFPPGVYGVSASGYFTGIQLKTGVYLSLYGAKLQAISYNQPGYRLINIEQVSNCGVFGGEIQGDRATNTATGEWGHCINIILDCANITIKDVRVSDGFGDGIYVGRQCSDVHILNCTVTNNRRNNISVVTASNVVIDGCDISNANGTLPECGIDVEPNPDDLPSSNVVITNCNIYGNNKEGIAYSAPPPTPLIESSIISNCHIYNNGSHGIVASYVKVLDVTNCVIRNNGGHGIYDSAALATLLNFRGNAIYDNALSGFLGFCSNTVIADNQIKGSGGWGVNWNFGQNVTISGNVISDSGEDGIRYERAYNCAIVGNTVKNSQKHGIFITGTVTSSVTRSRKVTIAGNTVSFSGLLADNTYSGIYLDAYANTSTVSANTVAAGTTGNLPQYAIFAADATVTVAGNQTDGGAKSGNSQVSVGGVALPTFLNSPNVFTHTYATRMYMPGLCFIGAGTGSPEGVLAAPVGSLFLRTDGGAGTSLYVKQSGTGNTGWAAK